MATYTYRCERDGVQDAAWPIGTAPDLAICPACGEPARRVLTVPRLSFGDPRARALLDRAARSASEPEVVPAVPATGRPAARPADPRLRRLPRP